MVRERGPMVIGCHLQWLGHPFCDSSRELARGAALAAVRLDGEHSYRFVGFEWILAFLAGHPADMGGRVHLGMCSAVPGYMEAHYGVGRMTCA